MRQKDERTIDEKIGDMLAENYSLQEIADELNVTYLQVRNRYMVMCTKLGERPE
jgi:predicted DNA-binding protein YlxM (UPF0122 family)